ncbi:MAG: carboxypeptidase-like regulatory domain-containing protein [Planctomycetota bacterium]
MKSFLVLLFVAIAAGGLFLVLRGDDGSSPGTGNTSVVERASDTETSDGSRAASPLADVDSSGGRGEARLETVPTVVEQDELADPVAAVGLGDLRGMVVDPDEKPVAGARIVLTKYGADSFFFGDVDRSSDVETRTGSDGTFAFEKVPVFESYSLIASHPDFSKTEAPSIIVQQGVTTEVPTIELGFGVMVRGTITDTGGNAVPGAKVLLTEKAFVSQPDGDDDGMQAETDEAGRYEFKNVTPRQNYALRVAAEGYGTVVLSGLAVTESEDLVQDVVLEVASMIAGVILAEGGEPLEGVKIQAWSLGTPGPRSATETKSLETGDFEITDIPPGEYQLVARHPRYAPNTGTRVESGTMTVSIELRPLPVVTGQVVDLSTGRPVTDFEAQLRQTVPGSQDGLSTAVPTTRQRFEDPDGKFEIVVPKGGEYMVEAIAAGFADTYSDSFQSNLGSDMGGVVVRMTRGGILVGRVLGDDGTPISGAVVETHDKEWSDDPFWDALGASAPGNATETSTRSGSDGSFRLVNLTPANYQLVVRHRDFAQQLVKDLSVTEGQELRVNDVRLPRGASISGMVLGPSGRPMAGAIVKLSPTTAGGRAHTVQTNRDGEYSVDHVREGTYKLYATRPRTGNDNPFQENIDLRATQRSLTVQNGQSVTGQDIKLSDV